MLRNRKNPTPEILGGIGVVGYFRWRSSGNLQLETLFSQVDRLTAERISMVETADDGSVEEKTAKPDASVIRGPDDVLSALPSESGSSLGRDQREAEHLGEGDALIRSVDEIFRAPGLSIEDEIQLVKRMEDGRSAEKALASGIHSSGEKSELERLQILGSEAKNSLIRANLKLVVSIAKDSVRPEGPTLLDLIQAGNEGLTVAAERFVSEKGFGFRTYATWWIRRAVSRAAGEPPAPSWANEMLEEVMGVGRS